MRLAVLWALDREGPQSLRFGRRMRADAYRRRAGRYIAEHNHIGSDLGTIADADAAVELRLRADIEVVADDGDFKRQIRGTETERDALADLA
jgi:hypothetical protein